MGGAGAICSIPCNNSPTIGSVSCIRAPWSACKVPVAYFKSSLLTPIKKHNNSAESKALGIQIYYLTKKLDGLGSEVISF